MSEWVSVGDRLPEDKQWVLVRLEKTNWQSDGKIVGDHLLRVVQFNRGLTEEDRELMRSGVFNNEIERCWNAADDYHDVPRSELYKGCDQKGNNLKPYNWSTFGASNFFGQEVEYWMDLPEHPRGALTNEEAVAAKRERHKNSELAKLGKEMFDEFEKSMMEVFE